MSFHTAFSLPTRIGLDAWPTHATSFGIPLTGASDHGVSDTVYLDDVEGNPGEVYANRPASIATAEAEQAKLVRIQ